MNYLYLIGNGFDVNLNIRADYQSFVDQTLANKMTRHLLKMMLKK